jgi:hypothetical protein
VDVKCSSQSGSSFSEVQTLVDLNLIPLDKRKENSKGKWLIEWFYQGQLVPQLTNRTRFVLNGKKPLSESRERVHPHWEARVKFEVEWVRKDEQKSLQSVYSFDTLDC